MARGRFVVLVPEAMASAVVDPMTAPALARLRAEGVYFINSHTGSPARELEGAAVNSLVAPDSYASVRIELSEAGTSVTASDDIEVDAVGVKQRIWEVLHALNETGKPFLLVYRLGQPQPGADSASPEGAADDPPAAMLGLFEADDDRGEPRCKHRQP